MENFIYSDVAYCKAKKKPFGWKWYHLKKRRYLKKYHEAMMKLGNYATVHWGADISKI